MGVPGPGSRASEFAAAPRDPKGEPRRAQLRSAAVERRFAERSSSLQSCINSGNASDRDMAEELAQRILRTLGDDNVPTDSDANPMTR